MTRLLETRKREIESLRRIIEFVESFTASASFYSLLCSVSAILDE